VNEQVVLDENVFPPQHAVPGQSPALHAEVEAE
jgi:hypothetical protein